jgi:hypothetical protein
MYIVSYIAHSHARVTFAPTFRSLSSASPISRPWAAAKRLPCTKLPTITDAGPTDASVKTPDPDEIPDICCNFGNEPNFVSLLG